MQEQQKIRRVIHRPGDSSPEPEVSGCPATLLSSSAFQEIVEAVEELALEDHFEDTQYPIEDPVAGEKRMVVD